MPHWTSPDVRVRVYTFKQGLLSAVGHDLMIEAGIAEVQDSGDSLTATIDVASLHVVAAMKNGSPSPGTLSDKDKADIDRNLHDHVLQPSRHPAIRFTAADRTEHVLVGILEMNGQQRDVLMLVHREGDREVATVELDQREWGIKPFSALLGALKVQPVVRVEASVPVAD